MNKPIKTLICSRCGKETQGRQWYNMDKGYGICDPCADELLHPWNRFYEDEMRDSYGIKGTHYYINPV